MLELKKKPNKFLINLEHGNLKEIEQYMSNYKLILSIIVYDCDLLLS